MLQVLSHELITVGFGQMQDVWPEEITQEKILELYMYKTGRYSFSLPMILGSLFGGEDVQFMKDVTHFGEAIGQLYQLTDDSLGLYGDAQKIGKPVGSDIKEGKQTLYWYLLLQHVTKEERETLLSLKGKDITESHIRFVKQLISRYAITEQIAQIQKKLEEEATMSINNIKIEEADKHVLLELVAFVTKREK
jgi:geranylgeranyl diphosphate synthase type I